MKLLGIKSDFRKKKLKYERSTVEASAKNLLKRDFNARKPNEKWATDVTEFKIIGSKQKRYLSAIIDLYDRSIISYIISHRNDNNLVFRTFERQWRRTQELCHSFIVIEAFNIQVRYSKILSNIRNKTSKLRYGIRKR